MKKETRQKALEYTIKLIKDDIFKDLPQFIFGDFNFRLDAKEVIRVCALIFGLIKAMLL